VESISIDQSCKNDSSSASGQNAAPAACEIVFRHDDIDSRAKEAEVAVRALPSGTRNVAEECDQGDTEIGLASTTTTAPSGNDIPSLPQQLPRHHSGHNEEQSSVKKREPKAAVRPIKMKQTGKHSPNAISRGESMDARRTSSVSSPAGQEPTEGFGQPLQSSGKANTVSATAIPKQSATHEGQQEMDVTDLRKSPNHPGNVNFLDMLEEYAPTFGQGDTKEKNKTIKQVIAAVRKLGGRFLDRKNCVLDDKKITAKVKSGLKRTYEKQCMEYFKMTVGAKGINALKDSAAEAVRNPTEPSILPASEAFPVGDESISTQAHSACGEKETENQISDSADPSIPSVSDAIPAQDSISARTDPLVADTSVALPVGDDSESTHMLATPDGSDGLVFGDSGETKILAGRNEPSNELEATVEKGNIAKRTADLSLTTASDGRETEFHSQEVTLCQHDSISARTDPLVADTSVALPVWDDSGSTRMLATCDGNDGPVFGDSGETKALAGRIEPSIELEATVGKFSIAKRTADLSLATASDGRETEFHSQEVTLCQHVEQHSARWQQQPQSYHKDSSPTETVKTTTPLAPETDITTLGTQNSLDVSLRLVLIFLQNVLKPCEFNAILVITAPPRILVR
jgi:hypothetical protein